MSLIFEHHIYEFAGNLPFVKDFRKNTAFGFGYSA